MRGGAGRWAARFLAQSARCAAGVLRDEPGEIGGAAKAEALCNVTHRQRGADQKASGGVQLAFREQRGSGLSCLLSADTR